MSVAAGTLDDLLQRFQAGNVPVSVSHSLSLCPMFCTRAALISLSSIVPDVTIMSIFQCKRVFFRYRLICDFPRRNPNQHRWLSLVSPQCLHLKFTRIADLREQDLDRQYKLVLADLGASASFAERITH